MIRTRISAINAGIEVPLLCLLILKMERRPTQGYCTRLHTKPAWKMLNDAIPVDFARLGGQGRTAIQVALPEKFCSC